MTKFGHVLSNDDALLEIKTGKSWSVKIEKIGERYCFCHGWPQFVKDNRLNTCDFLVFWAMFEGNTKFRVSMYEPSGCEKELDLGTIKEEEIIDIEDSDSDDPSTTSPNSTESK